MNLDDIREPRTKQEIQQCYAAYKRHQITWPPKTLLSAYKAPSAAKKSIYFDCLDMQKELGGIEGSIIYFNCHAFTFGFIVERTAGPYEERWFVYITKAANYKYLIYKRNRRYR